MCTHRRVVAACRTSPAAREMRKELTIVCACVCHACVQIQARRLAAAAESMAQQSDDTHAADSLDAQQCANIIRTLQVRCNQSADEPCSPRTCAPNAAAGRSVLLHRYTVFPSALRKISVQQLYASVPLNSLHAGSGRTGLTYLCTCARVLTGHLRCQVPPCTGITPVSVGGTEL